MEDLDQIYRFPYNIKTLKSIYGFIAVAIEFYFQCRVWCNAFVDFYKIVYFFMC